MSRRGARWTLKRRLADRRPLPRPSGRHSAARAPLALISSATPLTASQHANAGRS